MKRGFTAPLVLIIIALLFLIPFVYWKLISVKTSTAEQQANVQGASSSINTYLVTVNSHTKSWELFAYLCNSTDECSSGLFSGHFSQKISGGEGTDLQVSLALPSSAGEYSHLKLVMKPSWGFSSSYVPSDLVDGGLLFDISHEHIGYSVAVFPFVALESDLSSIVTFSDN